jgi:hypothetical protein
VSSLLPHPLNSDLMMGWDMAIAHREDHHSTSSLYSLLPYKRLPQVEYLEWSNSRNSELALDECDMRLIHYMNLHE